MNELILFEDDHLLVVNKPSGINTHKPDRFAPDGIHEWLTKREARWRNLSILQRLDKDTSGVIVFGKTQRANQSLTQQFEKHTVEKTYLLLSAVRPTRQKFWAKSPNCVTEFEFVDSQRRILPRASATAHGQDASDSPPRRGKWIPDTRRYTL